jgi:hypothetical protein
MSPVAADSPSLELSVILLCRDEAHTLHAVIDSLLHAMPLAPTWELLIVDGASQDGSASVAAELAAEINALQGRPACRVLANPLAVTPEGMRVGLAASTAPFVAFAGAHTLFPLGYFAQLLPRLQAGPSMWAAIGGRCRVIAHPAAGAWGRAIAAASDHWFGVGAAPYRHREVEGASESVMMPIYRRSWVDQVGGVPRELRRGQDYELNRRLRMAGGVLYLVPSLVCAHAARPTLRAFLRYRMATGFWPLYGTRFGAQAFAKRHMVPGVAALGWGVLCLLAWRWPALTVVPAMGLALYLGAALFAGRAAVRALGGGAMDGLLATVAMMAGHTAYALGTLTAALRRGRRQRAPWTPPSTEPGVVAT